MPFPNLGKLKLPSLPNRESGSTQSGSGPNWGSWRRSSGSRSGYSNVRADEHDHDEQEGFAGRFSLDDDDDESEAEERGLGEDRDAWRDIPGRVDENGSNEEQTRKGKGKVGVHQGLTHV